MTDVLQIELHWRPRWHVVDGVREQRIEHRCVVLSETTYKDALQSLHGHKVSGSGMDIAAIVWDIRESLSTLAAEMGMRVEIVVVRDDGESEAPDCEGESCGELHEDGLHISWGGNCPIQGDGTLDDQLCYYRSRGSGWSFDVWAPGAQMQNFGMDLPDEPEQWSYAERCYVWPEGGWISATETTKNLRKAVLAWRAHLKETQS